MDELIKLVSQKTGLGEDMAKTAVETVRRLSQRQITSTDCRAN